MIDVGPKGDADPGQALIVTSPLGTNPPVAQPLNQGTGLGAATTNPAGDDAEPSPWEEW
jgi:hypothetical protein